MVPRIVSLLEAGAEPVRVVCLGDSITGVYYHTGGRRAYSDMVGIALQRLYPQSPVQMINSGVSGNTTEAGLQRLESDVLDHRPHLVTVMFGMNDVARLPLEDFRRNLLEIADRCREAGAEVVLCTPNSVYPEDESRSMRALAQLSETVREVAASRGLRVADCWRVYEELRSRDERAWQLLLSETIHPNMNGHKVFAEEIVHTVTGARVDLTDVGPPQPALPATWARLAAGQPVRAVAMPPFDALIGPALERVCPGAQVGVTSWPVAVRALAQIEAYARDGIGWQHFQAHPEDARPDLVLIAVPPEADAESEEAFIRSYSWVLNWSLSFGAQEWDCAAALPSVVAPAPSPSQHEREALARQVIQGQDIGLVERPVGETGSAHELLARWVAANVGEGGA